jgi:hypothetical protein
MNDKCHNKDDKEIKRLDDEQDKKLGLIQGEFRGVLNGGVILIRNGDAAEGGLVMCLTRSAWPSHAIFVDAQHIQYMYYVECTRST